MQASLFVSCVVDQFFPEVGESTFRVLRRLGVEVDFPAGQTCCGQPAFNSGYWNEAKPLARRVLRQFKDKEHIVVPSGSCASMLRVFYAELFRDEPDALRAAEELAPRVYELSEYIVDVLKVTDASQIGGRSQSSPEKVTYHEGCHLRRELGATTQARVLIGSAPGVELVEMEQPDVCCGFGGTFSVKYPDISGAMLADKVDDIGRTGAGAVVACDSSCLMQIGGGLRARGLPTKAVHLAQLLDGAAVQG